MKQNTFSKRNTQMTKGIAIILMMMVHCLLPERYDLDEIIRGSVSVGFLTKIANFSKICVGMFAFLSAYGITLSLKGRLREKTFGKKELMQYIFNRWFAIMSGFWFIFIIVEVFCLVMNGRPITQYGKGLIGVYHLFIEFLGLSKLMGTPKLIETWWYMSFAILIIIFVPFMVKLYNKVGLLLLPIMFFLPRAFGLAWSTFLMRYFVLGLGIVCADLDLLVKLKRWKFHRNPYVSKLLKWVLLTGILVLMFIFRGSTALKQVYEVTNGVIPAFAVYYGYEFLHDIKVLGNVLEFLGKHSMNIFLFHSFIYLRAYFHDFIYSPRYIPLIILLLLVVSVLVSIVLEFVKKCIRYDKGMEAIKKKLERILFVKLNRGA